ncbi:MAG: outer membrane protein assembly factor BamA, partial [Desulfobacterales bacterium]|nr:outer membrane protein assembly factor BamA [Desulfobacterales bacterium]
MRIVIWTLAAAGLFFVLHAAAGAETYVEDVRIQGNERIESDAILRVIKTGEGELYDEDRLSADLEAIYNMGYFDDVRVETKKTEEGNIVIFTVEEKPTLRSIEIEGNQILEDEQIKEVIDISSGSILNIARIKSNLRAIENLYEEKNYHNASADYEIEELDHNRADLKFVIKEGKKVLIRQIRIEGNKDYSDKELRGLMKTSEKWFLSWLTSAGDLNMQKLEQDVQTLENHYQNNGYFEARVAEPQIRYEKDGIYITIKIHEGPRFKMGSVSFKGDLLVSADKLKEKISIDQQKYYSRNVVRNDIIALNDIYADKGYARADIRPEINKRTDENVIDIVFHLKKNKPVYFEKIIIEGNTKTRDKVIRRELQVYEQGKYSSSRLKRSVRNIHRLDYFEDVNISP